MPHKRAQRRVNRVQYSSGRTDFCPESGDARRFGPAGLPCRTSPWDVRIVERVRLCEPGFRSTTSLALPRTYGGPGVVRSRLLTSRCSRLTVLLLLAVALAASSCGDDDDASSSPPTTRPATTTSNDQETSTTSAGDDSQVRAAYDAANRAFIDAAAIPDPNFPAIAASHTAPMLEQRREVLRGLQLDGRIIRHPEGSQYRVVVESIETEAEVSRIKFCAVDDAERVDTRTGEVISGGLVTVRGEAALRQEGRIWKLAEARSAASS